MQRPGVGTLRDANRVAELVSVCLPHLGGHAIELLGEGDFCTAFLIGGEHVVRVAKHARAAAALQREACVLAAIGSGLDVPVPRPAFVPCPQHDAAFTVHRLLRGTPLSRDLWSAVPAAQRERLAARVGEILSTLHSLDVSTVRHCGVQVFDHAAQRHALHARMHHAAFPPALRNALVQRFRQSEAGGADGQFVPAILHADVSPEHVLVPDAAHGITGIIDWGDVCIGDPARDLIFLYEDWGSDFLRLALRGYARETPERLLPRVYQRYLEDQLAWTLDACNDGRDEDIAHGITALDAALHDSQL